MVLKLEYMFPTAESKWPSWETHHCPVFLSCLEIKQQVLLKMCLFMRGGFFLIFCYR